VRLDDTMTATPTLQSVGHSAPFSSTGGRPIHANGEQAVGTQRAAGSEQQTSPPVQQVETTGQRNLHDFLDRYLKGEEFERGLLEKLQQCALEDLQTLAVKANLNPNLEKSMLARSIHCTYCMGSEGENGEASTGGRPIHANGKQAVGTQKAAARQRRTRSRLGPSDTTPSSVCQSSVALQRCLRAP